MEAHAVYRSQFFRLLLIFRWASLVPPLVLVRQTELFVFDVSPAWALLVAAAANLVITLWSRPLNRLLLERPRILLLEILYSTLLLLLTGGVGSPYYLHALSPLLAAAFFFQVSGGAASAAAFSVFYLSGLYLVPGLALVEGQINGLIVQLAGIGLIPAVVGAVSGRTRDLGQATAQFVQARQDLERRNAELQETHARLQTIHDLTLLLQAAPDVHSMQAQVLRILSTSLQVRDALLGIVQPSEKVLHSWMALQGGDLAENGAFSGLPKSLPAAENGFLGEVLRSRDPHPLAASGLDQLPPGLQAWAAGDPLILLPLVFHEEPVGLLMLRGTGQVEMDADERTLLRTLANQAATSLGTTILCVERARDLAVEQERNRIAREIHDTVSQSLFGMVYSLDACIRMLPEREAEVKNELGEIQNLANLTRDQVRHSIFDLWPSSLTLDVFKADLSQYVAHCFRLKPFEIHYEIEGDFDSLSPAVRRNLYRITQEALSNTMHHAGVAEATVRLAIGARELCLEVIDQGVGFDLQNALGREYSREHFGLHGIQERAGAMHGECRIESLIDQGTRVQVRVPLSV